MARIVCLSQILVLQVCNNTENYLIPYLTHFPGLCDRMHREMRNAASSHGWCISPGNLLQYLDGVDVLVGIDMSFSRRVYA